MNQLYYKEYGLGDSFTISHVEVKGRIVEV